MTSNAEYLRDAVCGDHCRVMDAALGCVCAQAGAIIDAALNMPRTIPDADAASTEHAFKISAADVRQLDRALKGMRL